jgi:hypothetical protein
LVDERAVFAACFVLFEVFELFVDERFDEALAPFFVFGFVFAAAARFVDARAVPGIFKRAVLTVSAATACPGAPS